MKDKISIIAGGSGQFGVYLSQFLLKKGYKIIITTRNVKLAKKKDTFHKQKFSFIKIKCSKKKGNYKAYFKISSKAYILLCEPKFPKVIFCKKKNYIK